MRQRQYDTLESLVPSVRTKPFSALQQNVQPQLATTFQPSIAKLDPPFVSHAAGIEVKLGVAPGMLRRCESLLQNV